MKIWPGFPFVRIVLPLISGILVYRYLSDWLTLPFYSIAIPVLVLIMARFSGRIITGYGSRWVFGLLLNLVFIMLGFQLASLQHELDSADHFSVLMNEEKSLFSGILAEPPAERANSFRAVANIDRIYQGQGAKTCKGRVMVYFSKDTVVTGLKYGSRIIFSTAPVRVNPPANPGEFDYAGYLANKVIYHQVYLKPVAYRVVKGNEGHWLKALAFGVRDRFLQTFSRYGIGGREFAVAAALMIGYDDRLDPEQRREFSGAGAMHVLCVSGLHVGIVFLMADKLFFFLGRRKKGKVLKPMMIILVIWLYALITGLAPSVMRASLMFSLVTVGNALNRKSHIYNTLATSAFILLIINPAILFEVGFQLSYAAVIGIVTFQPYFKKIWVPPSGMLKYFWDILLVSLAAQLATGPLSVMYFHQFPNYFLLTNLLVIPFAGILIYTGVVFLVFAVVPAFGKIAALVLVSEIKALNWLIALIEGLPGAVSRNLFLPGFSTLLLYMLVLALFALYLSNKRIWFSIALATMLLLAADHARLNVLRAKQQMLIVHSMNRHTVISLVQGRVHNVLADSAVISEPGLLNYPLEGLRIKSGLRPPVLVGFGAEIPAGEQVHFYKKGFLSFNGSRFAVISGGFRKPPPGRTIDVDYVILTSNAKINADDLTACFPGAEFIADASNAYRRIMDWKAGFDKAGVKFHPVKDEGAWILSFPR